MPVHNGEDVHAVCKRRRIRCCGTRGDDIQGVPDHVGNDDAHHTGRSGHPGQLATAEAGQMFPDGVEFRDGRAAAQQQLRHLLHVFQRDPGHRGRRQSAGPACEQAQDQIICRGPGSHIQQCLRGRRPCRIGDGMGGLHLGDLLQRQAVTVFDHQHPAIDTVPQQLFHGSAHGGDPFPGPQYQQTSPARQ